MKKALTLIVCLIILADWSYGQQDPMFTKYMFNSLTFNPAYAGSRDYMYVGALHRTQWVGLEGAPQTQTLTAHTPLKNERVGVGLTLVNDKIGPTNTLGANLVYAYRIPLGEKLKLSVGIQGGIENYRANWDDLTFEDSSGDEAFLNNENRLLPNFGAGIFVYSKYFYLGASSPHLVEYDLRDSITTNFYARQARHYYFMAGAAIPISGDQLIFKPSVLLKNVGLLSSSSKLESFRDIGAPTEIDIDISFLFYETLWVGAAFRTALEKLTNDQSSFDSADLWVSILLKNGLRVGAAFDYPLNELSNVTSGSFELMVGYEFNFDRSKTITPRYF